MNEVEGEIEIDGGSVDFRSGNSNTLNFVDFCFHVHQLYIKLFGFGIQEMVIFESKVQSFV